MRETLRRSRPVLMIESANEPVREVLGELGYEAFAYDADAHVLPPEGERPINTLPRRGRPARRADLTRDGCPR